MTNNRFMFTGREYIQQFAIYEYRARTYHPGVGRFMSEDPKGFDAGDYNLFRYCKNDPLDLTDPMGLAYQPGANGMPGPWSGYSDTGYSIDRWGPTPQSSSEAQQGTTGLGIGSGNGSGVSVSLNMCFAGLAARVGQQQRVNEETQKRYAEEGTAIDRLKAFANAAGALDRQGNKRQSGDLRLTNYGFKGDNMIGDPNTPRGLGVGNRILTENSVALSRDLAKQFHLDRGIYVNGQYIGNFKDTTSDRSVRTIDVYDPHGKGQWRAFMAPRSYNIAEGPAVMDY